jgi:ABC-type transport system involved in cytochrome c biogenesis permease subunit
MTRLTKLFPSLHDLDRINHFCISCGFPLMTMGIIAGSVWARAVWGSHWQWDPKQVWTLTVWGGYAMLLHQRLAIGWKGHKAALFSVIAFLVVFAFLVAENMFLVTVHRFG